MSAFKSDPLFPTSFELETLRVKEARFNAYKRNCDPLFFKWQRGENTEQAWLDSLAAIDDANPYPVQESTP
jgi:hypothetical protein